MKYLYLTLTFLFALSFVPHAADAATCHLIDRNDSVQSGFGVPYAPFSSAREMLMTIDCDGRDVTLTAGSGKQEEFIYETGYQWTGSGWSQISFNGSKPNGVWFQEEAKAEFRAPDTDETYFTLSYICTWTGSQWKCGCRTSGCSTSYWQLQAYEAQSIASPPPSNGSSSGGGSNGTHDDALLEEIAQEIHRLTNVERQKAGLPALQYDDRLSRIGIGHSEDMATRNFFSHTNPSGCTFTCRFENANYNAQVWGENIAFIETLDTDTLAERFVENWMNSRSHRENILADDFTHEGIGMAVDGVRYYASAEFARPR